MQSKIPGYGPGICFGGVGKGAIRKRAQTIRTLGPL